MYNVAVLLPHKCLATSVVWALPRSLATTCGIIRLFSPPMGIEMFQFPTFAPHSRYQAFNLVGCPIRKSADQRIFAPTHSLSQLITSFFASESHRHPPCALPFFFLLVYSNSLKISFAKTLPLMLARFRDALASHRCTRICFDNALALFSVTTCQRSSLIPLRVEIVVR